MCKHLFLFLFQTEILVIRNGLHIFNSSYRAITMILNINVRWAALLNIISEFHKMLEKLPNYIRKAESVILSYFLCSSAFNRVVKY